MLLVNKIKDKIKNDKISLIIAKSNQEDFERDLGEIKKGNKKYE